MEAGLGFNVDLNYGFGALSLVVGWTTNKHDANGPGDGDLFLVSAMLAPAGGHFGGRCWLHN